MAEEKASAYSGALQDFPINVDAGMQCYSGTGVPTMGGVMVNTSCSNKGRLIRIENTFKESGLRLVPAGDPAAPTVVVKTEKINGFLEQTTGFFNLFTLGLLPIYSYTDYVVSYKSEKDHINFSKTVRVSSTTTWFFIAIA